MALAQTPTLQLTIETRRLAGPRRLSRHRPRPLLPGRHHRPGHRADRARPRPCAAQCEAQAPCLEFALATNQDSGVWGGTSEEERRKLRKPVARPPAPRRLSPLPPPPDRPPAPRRAVASCRRSGGHSARRSTGTPEADARCPARRRRRCPRMSIVPASSVVDERPHDRQAEAGRRVEGEARRAGRRRRRRPCTTQVARRRCSSVDARTSAGLGLQVDARREGVVDHVLQQLGEHDRQRRGHRGRAASPASPSTVKRTGRSGDSRPSSTMRTRGRTISTNGTSSPASRDRISCTRAIERMRRTDSSMAALASGDAEPPALQPQQRRDRLQVVLHPVVDLADRGVLREQQPVPAAQLGDVAQQHDARR